MDGIGALGRSREGLRLADYERVFSVLERCDTACSVVQFKRRVLESVRSAFDVRYVTFFVGSSLLTAFTDPQPLYPSGYREDQLMAEYRDRWRPADPYATPQGLEQLNRSGVVVLDSLRRLPVASTRFVREFLCVHGIAGSAAMRLPLPGGGVGLIGLYGGHFSPGHDPSLRLLTRRLSAISRLLPVEPMEHSTDVLTHIDGRLRDVAHLVGEGLTNAEIAARLCLAEDTVKKYVSRILTATGCRSRTKLALCVERGRG